MFQGQTERDMLSQANLNPKDFFSCNHKWPVCRFNFAKEHTIVEEFVFKVESLADVEIFHDYFDANKFEKRMNRKPPASTVKNLLLERGQHYCRIKDFTQNFAAMFTSEDEETQSKLLLCKDLDVKRKMTHSEAHKKVLKFCSQVRKFDS